MNRPLAWIQDLQTLTPEGICLPIFHTWYVDRGQDWNMKFCSSKDQVHFLLGCMTSGVFFMVAIVSLDSFWEASQLRGPVLKGQLKHPELQNVDWKMGFFQ